jgi:prepilin-type N-terminal cleavage/methylation domain-containing protein
MNTRSKKAFTLSELLVSLSVLGLIAAITLPSIFNAVEAQKKNAVFKETYNTMDTLVQQYLMENTPALVSGGIGHPYFPWIAARVNAAQDCSQTGIKAQGCVSSSYIVASQPGVGSDIKGVKLSNGALLMFPWAGGGANSVRASFRIDYNGEAGPNVFGSDVLAVQYCLGPETTNCGALPVHRNIVYIGLGGQVENDNRDLWDSIWE